MRKTTMIIILVLSCSASVNARDFWTIYGEHLVYNHAVKAGTGASLDFNHRLSSDEILSIASKSFSQSLGVRFTEIARSRRGVLLVCIFSPEPDRCYFDVVMNAFFDEVQILNPPGVSQKFLTRFRRFYVGGLLDRSSFSARKYRSALVPPWKKFNPLFGFSPTDMELVASTPFYSFFGVYVEPQYGTHKGFSLGFMKDRWYMDLYKDRVTFGYKFPHMINKRFHTTVIISKGPEIRIDNTLLSF